MVTDLSFCPGSVQVETASTSTWDRLPNSYQNERLRRATRITESLAEETGQHDSGMPTSPALVQNGRQGPLPAVPGSAVLVLRNMLDVTDHTADSSYQTISGGESEGDADSPIPDPHSFNPYASIRGSIDSTSQRLERQRRYLSDIRRDAQAEQQRLEDAHALYSTPGPRSPRREHPPQLPPRAHPLRTEYDGRSPTIRRGHTRPPVALSDSSEGEGVTVIGLEELEAALGQPLRKLSQASSASSNASHRRTMRRSQRSSLAPLNEEQGEDEQATPNNPEPDHLGLISHVHSAHTTNLPAAIRPGGTALVRSSGGTNGSSLSRALQIRQAELARSSCSSLVDEQGTTPYAQSRSLAILQQRAAVARIQAQGSGHSMRVRCDSAHSSRVFTPSIPGSGTGSEISLILSATDPPARRPGSTDPVAKVGSTTSCRPGTKLPCVNRLGADSEHTNTLVRQPHASSDFAEDKGMRTERTNSIDAALNEKRRLRDSIRLQLAGWEEVNAQQQVDAAVDKLLLTQDPHSDLEWDDGFEQAVEAKSRRSSHLSTRQQAAPFVKVASHRPSRHSTDSRVPSVTGMSSTTSRRGSVPYDSVHAVSFARHQPPNYGPHTRFHQILSEVAWAEKPTPRAPRRRTGDSFRSRKHSLFNSIKRHHAPGCGTPTSRRQSSEACKRLSTVHCHTLIALFVDIPTAMPAPRLHSWLVPMRIGVFLQGSSVLARLHEAALHASTAC
ncbi:uncharacterized protein MONBRDRAFT_9367 [Monosiga brevicollis MX1]|uniref:Uncharacterized protein n=1 Tax=Monosiga brevicollis TaxID=81824 RepID=A9V2X6_MONBE|nr:uncharacterized protein MONBRDRAFT_9367 [Monosiga brevicollis MX1]EDQ88091.1 predicted protein [Monosiga brevicollis MX1]|eukprot:XP_001747167.1 hypothetical protein [Monosiga brevicollis MX1]